MKRWLPVALALGLAACDTTVTKEEMQTADYGPAPVHYQDEIKSYLSLRLTDPKDAVVEFRTQPKQLYQRGTPVRGEQYGWGVCVWVNDKNRSGAYDGYYPMTLFIRNEKIIHANNDPDHRSPVYSQFAREQCAVLGAPFGS